MSMMHLLAIGSPEWQLKESNSLKAIFAGRKKTYPEQKTYLKRYIFEYVFSFAPNPGLPRDAYRRPEILSYLVQYFSSFLYFYHTHLLGGFVDLFPTYGALLRRK
jgi:hypothetical protein